MKVLFVCSGNAHRSPLAEALLKNLRPDWQVDSAGTSTAIPVSTKVRKYLEGENAAQFLKKFPESLSDKRLKEYDLIIVMEQKHMERVRSMCLECEKKTVVWNIEDPYSMQSEDAERIYRKIKEKVTQLAKSS